jgi:hypothetical protein
VYLVLRPILQVAQCGAPSGNDIFTPLRYPILGIAFNEEALGGPGTRNPITELTIRQKAEPFGECLDSSNSELQRTEPSHS